MDQTSNDVSQLKESRKQLTNIFALLYKAKFEGGQSEAVFNALKFVDKFVGELNNQINALEPVVVAPTETPVEPSPAVQDASSSSVVSETVPNESTATA